MNSTFGTIPALILQQVKMSSSNCGQNFIENALSDIFQHISINPSIGHINPKVMDSSVKTLSERSVNTGYPQQQGSHIENNGVQQSTMAIPHSYSASTFPFFQPMHSCGPYMAQNFPPPHQSFCGIRSSSDDAWLDSLNTVHVQSMSDQNIQEIRMHDVANLSYEEKRAQSAFYKFLYEYKTRSLAQGPNTDAQKLDSETSAESTMHEHSAKYDLGSQLLSHPETSGAHFYGYTDDAVQQDISLTDLKNTCYPFTSPNAYLAHPEPFQEGQRLLNEGQITQAVLAFEAQCQRKENDSQAWFTLGTTQQQNEKDVLAIIALQNAIQKDASCADVHLALAASQTNEHLFSEALQSITSWLRSKMAFSTLQLHSDESSLEKEITAGFEANPQDIDFQIALGVYYCITHNYTGAAAIFEKAVEKNPQSASLWNKLGAALANSGNTEKALDAYRRSIAISPHSHRCKYNIAVALMNIGKNVEAAHELIEILRRQCDLSPGASHDIRKKSHDVWNTLRINVEILGREDLLEALESEDIERVSAGLGF